MATRPGLRHPHDDATAEILGDRLSLQRLAAYMGKCEDRIRGNLHSTPEAYAASLSAAVRIIPARLRAW